MNLKDTFVTQIHPLPTPDQSALSNDSSQSQVLIEDIADKLAALGDSRHAYDLIEMLVDPVVPDGVYVPQPDGKQLGALLRIVNGHFYTWLSSAEAMLERASQPATAE